MELERKLRTSVRNGKSKTGEPHGRVLDGGESPAGGEEEISGDCVRRGGKLKKAISESVHVPEAGSAGNRFWKKDELKQEERCQHERFQPDDPRPSGMMGNESEKVPLSRSVKASLDMKTGESDLPANERSDKGTAGDAQCPNSQCGTTIFGRIHLLHICCAQGQRSTHP